MIKNNIFILKIRSSFYTIIEVKHFAIEHNAYKYAALHAFKDAQNYRPCRSNFWDNTMNSYYLTNNNKIFNLFKQEKYKEIVEFINSIQNKYFNNYSNYIIEPLNLSD